MVKLLRECLVKAKDMASEIIPGAISQGMKVKRLFDRDNKPIISYICLRPMLFFFFKVKAHMFDGYWEDVKSIGAYYRANMESIKRCKTLVRIK